MAEIYEAQEVANNYLAVYMINNFENLRDALWLKFMKWLTIFLQIFIRHW